MSAPSYSPFLSPAGIKYRSEKSSDLTFKASLEQRLELEFDKLQQRADEGQAFRTVFGEALKTLMTIKGISNHELANQVRCTSTQIRYILNGTRGTSVRSFLAICDVLNIPSGALLFRSRTTMSPSQIECLRQRQVFYRQEIVSAWLQKEVTKAS